MEWKQDRNSSSWRLKGILKNLQGVANNPSLTVTEKSHVDSAIEHIEQALVQWNSSHATSKVRWNRHVKGTDNPSIKLSVPSEVSTYVEDMYSFCRRPSNVNALNEQ